MSANTPSRTPISIDAITNLIKGGDSGDKRLDCKAAGEMLKWADEHLNDIAKGTVLLERKMHIMLVANTGILYLLFQVSHMPAPQFSFLPLWSHACMAWGWFGMKCIAWAAIGIAMVFAGWGLFVPVKSGLRGTDPNEWGLEYLTMNTGDNPSSNAKYILGYLCAKYCRRIRQSMSIHQCKLCLYRLGLMANCILFAVMMLAVGIRILQAMPL